MSIPRTEGKYHNKTLYSSILIAVVSVIIGVCLQKYLDYSYPTPIVIKEQKQTGLYVPALSYSYSYISTQPASSSSLFGLIKDYPTYVYELCIGNISDYDSGIISVSIIFPEEAISVTALAFDNEWYVYRNTKKVYFQLSEITSNSGIIRYIYVKSESMPDLNSTIVIISSQAGEFNKTPKVFMDRILGRVPDN